MQETPQAPVDPDDEVQEGEDHDADESFGEPDEMTGTDQGDSGTADEPSGVDEAA